MFSPRIRGCHSPAHSADHARDIARETPIHEVSKLLHRLLADGSALARELSDFRHAAAERYTPASWRLATASGVPALDCGRLLGGPYAYEETNFEAKTSLGIDSLWQIKTNVGTYSPARLFGRCWQHCPLWLSTLPESRTSIELMRKCIAERSPQPKGSLLGWHWSEDSHRSSRRRGSRQG